MFAAERQKEIDRFAYRLVTKGTVEEKVLELQKRKKVLC